MIRPGQVLSIFREIKDLQMSGVRFERKKREAGSNWERVTGSLISKETDPYLYQYRRAYENGSVPPLVTVSDWQAFTPSVATIRNETSQTNRVIRWPDPFGTTTTTGDAQPTFSAIQSERIYTCGWIVPGATLQNLEQRDLATEMQRVGITFEINGVETGVRSDWRFDSVPESYRRRNDSPEIAPGQILTSNSEAKIARLMFRCGIGFQLKLSTISQWQDIFTHSLIALYESISIRRTPLVASVSDVAQPELQSQNEQEGP